MRLGVISVLAACGAAGVVGCGSGTDEVPANAVAKVGGTVITKADFDRRFAAIAASNSGGAKPIVYEPSEYTRCVATKADQYRPPEGQKGKPEDTLRKDCDKEYQGLRAQAMEFLVQQAWIEAKAKELHVTVTTAEIAAGFEKQKDAAFPTKADYEKYVSQSGVDESDIRLGVELTLLQQKLTDTAVAAKAKVSDAEAKAFYEKTKKRLGQPTRRSLRMVIAKTEGRADEAKQAIGAGKSWDEVAKEYSIDKESASKGGRLSNIAATGDKTIDAALADSEIGIVDGPTKTQFGWWVFEVEKVTPRTIPSFDKARAQIVAQLKQQKRQKALDRFATSFREEYRGQSTCADGFEVASCKNGPQENPTVPTPEMSQPSPEQDN